MSSGLSTFMLPVEAGADHASLTPSMLLAGRYKIIRIWAKAAWAVSVRLRI